MVQLRHTPSGRAGVGVAACFGKMCVWRSPPLGTVCKEVANITDVSDFLDSRGGTRTRDPGIMSAVL